MKLPFAMLLLAEGNNYVDSEPVALIDSEKDGEAVFEVSDAAHFETLVEFIQQDFESACKAAKDTCCPICSEDLDYSEVTLESFNEMLKTAKLETKTMGTVSRLYVS